MRFNFYEHVRSQLGGELERLLDPLGIREVVRVFLGYITVFRVII